MNFDLLQILVKGTAASARMLYFMSVNMCVGVGFIKSVLKKKHSYRILYWYLVYKVVMYNWLYLQIIGIYQLRFEWAWIIHVIVSVIHYLVLLGIFCYTFYGTILKVAITSAFSDTAGTVIGCGIQFLLNFLERRENILDMSGSLHPLDILFPFLCYMIYQIIQKMGRKFFQWAREHEVKHTRLWGTFFGFHLLIGLFSVQGFSNRKLSIMMQSISILALGFLVIVLYLGISIFQSYQRQVVQKNRFLVRQQELIFQHSKRIQQQVLQTERLQRQLDEQMRKILECKETTDLDVRIRSYLSQLKEQYQTVEEMEYCKEWMVDAVLTDMVRRLRKQEVICELHFQNYDRGIIDSVDMAQLMMYLLNLKIVSFVSIRTGIMETGVFIEFICPDIRKKRVIKKAVRSLLEKYRGEIWQGTGKEKHTFLLRFPGN